MSWNPREKPPSDVCPKDFCFFWSKRGARIDLAGRLFESLEDALEVLATETPVVRFSAGCRCVFGTCSRAVPAPGNRDWYEPHEPALKKAGLPWFYFIPSADKLVEDVASFLGR